MVLAACASPASRTSAEPHRLRRGRRRRTEATPAGICPTPLMLAPCADHDDSRPLPDAATDPGILPSTGFYSKRRERRLPSISLDHDSPGLADGGGDLAATRGLTVRPAWRRALVGQAGPLSGGPKRVRRAGASGRRPGRGRRAAVEATHIGVTLTQECVTDVATAPLGGGHPLPVPSASSHTRTRMRSAAAEKVLTPFLESSRYLPFAVPLVSLERCP
jgi:hypothetical protein